MIQSQFQFDDRRQAPKKERKPKTQTIEKFFLDEFAHLYELANRKPQIQTVGSGFTIIPEYK
jgi:hypothetical protein